MRNLIAPASFSFVITFALVGPSAAQNPPAPWVRLNVIEVQPARVDEFLAVERELTARAKKAKVAWRSVSRTEVFGDTYRFLVATPVEKLASFDEAEGEEPDRALAALIRRIEKCVTSRTSYAVRTLPSIGNPLPKDEVPDLMIVNVARIAPGREQDYLKVMTSDFLPHFDEAEIHYVTGALAFGGEGGFIHVFYVDDFAELDKGSPVMRALGSDGAQAATAKLSGIVTGNELWIARVVPELSYFESPPESDEP